MSNTSNPVTGLDYEQTLQSAYNEVNASITTVG